MASYQQRYKTDKCPPPLYTTNNYYGSFETETTEEKMANLDLMERCRIQEKELDNISKLLHDKEMSQADELSRVEHEKNISQMNARHFDLQFVRMECENNELESERNKLKMKNINLESENDKLNAQLDFLRGELRQARKRVNSLSEDKQFGMFCFGKCQALKKRIEKLEELLNGGGDLLNPGCRGDQLKAIPSPKVTRPEIPEASSSTSHPKSEVATMTEEDIMSQLLYHMGRANYMESLHYGIRQNSSENQDSQQVKVEKLSARRVLPEPGQCETATTANREIPSKKGDVSTGSKVDDQMVPAM